jgi:hypothetical protein
MQLAFHMRFDPGLIWWPNSASSPFLSSRLSLLSGGLNPHSPRWLPETPQATHIPLQVQRGVVVNTI